MNNNQIRITRIHILPQGDPLFSIFATTIEIDDESAGEYLIVTQQGDAEESMNQQIYIEPENWEVLKKGIEMMLAEIKDNKKEEQP